MNCVCPLAGHCPAFGKIQSPRQWQICRGEVLTPEACDAYRANWLAMALSRGQVDPLACAHRGEVIDYRRQKVESKTCGSCAKRGETVPVFACHLHGRCTLRPWQSGQVEAVCGECHDRRVLRPAVLDRRRIDSRQLLPSLHQFNNSLIRFGGRLLMAYRVGWNDPRLAVAELDEQYQVLHNSWLPLRLGAGQEDPRLWVFRGELFVSYSAVHPRADKTVSHTDVCYAQLVRRDDGYWDVAEEYFPRYAGRAAWEKNWGFFEHDGELLAVYSISPHRVLKIDGDHAELVAETACPFPRKPGLLHGGAPPVFHRGEYYCFYHRRLGSSREKWYMLDLYTFEGQAPFRPARHIEAPLLWPDVADRPEPNAPHAIFPGGAFLDSDHRWCLSFGYYDFFSELAWLSINDVEACLTPLPGGPQAHVSLRQGTHDSAIWKEVYEWNEYGLPPQFTAEDVIIDVGAHIGSFARACLDRGAGQVICCEPFPPSFQLLKNNVAFYAHRADCLQVAVGGSEGTLTLTNRDTSGTSYSAVSGHFQANGAPIVGEATQVTLDYVLPKGPVRLLKIDCEGAEHEALAAADLSRVAEIVGECHALRPGGVAAGEQNMDTLAACLRAKGFSAIDSRDQGNGTWLFTARR